jgi:hypothetical protein
MDQIKQQIGTPNNMVIGSNNFVKGSQNVVLGNNDKILGNGNWVMRSGYNSGGVIMNTMVADAF